MTEPVFFNTLGRKLEPFRPVVPGEARVYICGPTVYNEVHIGNLRTFLFGDLLRRSLRHLGYRVTQVMNLTDVDDKTIQGAYKAGLSLTDYTAPFIQTFLRDLDTLHMERVEHFPKATDHIPQMIGIIQTLIDKGYAYETEGSVFFSIGKDEDYGHLSGFDLDQARRGERVASDEYAKEDVRDFGLWKAVKPGEPSWDSPWGPGRPGWHIECSAMSMQYLGETFDLHCGGVDLIFPHHENEIAQSESATGKTFVRTWLHAEHLIVDGQKMSKSLGNQYTLPQLLERGCSPRALRRIDEMRFRLQHAEENGSPDARLAEAGEKLLQDFAAALADDLNLAVALAALFAYVKEVNVAIEEKRIGEGDRQRILDTLRAVDGVLGVLDPADWPEGKAEEDDSAEIERLIQERNEARKNRDFKTSDRVRDELAARGIVLEDTPQGTRWKRK